jgi:hypothetical protein
LVINEVDALVHKGVGKSIFSSDRRGGACKTVSSDNRRLLAHARSFRHPRLSPHGGPAATTTYKLER